MATPNYVLEAIGKATEIRNQFDLGDDAIKDIFHFIEEYGVLLALRPLGLNGIDGIYARRSTIALIVVNSEKLFERQRFTAAHELAHHLFDRSTDNILTVDEDIFGPRSVAERRANAFAAHFLMPAGVVKRLVRNAVMPEGLSPYDVVHMQYHFGVSYQAAIYHLHNLGHISSSQRDHWLHLQPTRMAFELGYIGLAEDVEPSTKNKLPADFVSRAIKAYKQADITLNRLAELLEVDSEKLKDKLESLGIVPDDSCATTEADEIW